VQCADLVHSFDGIDDNWDQTDGTPAPKFTCVRKVPIKGTNQVLVLNVDHNSELADKPTVINDTLCVDIDE